MFCFAGLAGVCVPPIKFLLHRDGIALFTFARLTQSNLLMPSHKMTCILLFLEHFYLYRNLLDSLQNEVIRQRSRSDWKTMCLKLLALGCSLTNLQQNSQLLNSFLIEAQDLILTGIKRVISTFGMTSLADFNKIYLE